MSGGRDMRRHNIWICVALVSGIAGVAAAQKPVKCDDCKPEVEITSDNWPCMKRWVDDSGKAQSDPFEFPVFAKGQCDKSLSFAPYSFDPYVFGKQTEVAKPVITDAPEPTSWMSLRVSEAKCLSGLGPTIDKKLSGSGKVVVSLTGTSCKIQG